MTSRGFLSPLRLARAVLPRRISLTHEFCVCKGIAIAVQGSFLLESGLVSMHVQGTPAHGDMSPTTAVTCRLLRLLRISRIFRFVPELGIMVSLLQQWTTEAVLVKALRRWRTRPGMGRMKERERYIYIYMATYIYIDSEREKNLC